MRACGFQIHCPDTALYGAPAAPGVSTKLRRNAIDRKAANRHWANPPPAREPRLTAAAFRAGARWPSAARISLASCIPPATETSTLISWVWARRDGCGGSAAAAGTTGRPRSPTVSREGEGAGGAPVAPGTFRASDHSRSATPSWRPSCTPSATETSTPTGSAPGLSAGCGGAAAAADTSGAPWSEAVPKRATVALAVPASVRPPHDAAPRASGFVDPGARGCGGRPRPDPAGSAQAPAAGSQLAGRVRGTSRPNPPHHNDEPPAPPPTPQAETPQPLEPFPDARLCLPRLCSPASLPRPPLLFAFGVASTVVLLFSALKSLLFALL